MKPFLTVIAPAVAVLVVSGNFLANAATYYVSSGGSDSYTAAQAQNQATPWKTLAKINSAAFAPGDNILFKRGEVWRGTLVVSSSGSNGNPITIGAWGTGGNPVIKGTEPIAATWSLNGTIYQTGGIQSVITLFADGYPLTFARYPNEGYLPITDTLGPTTIHCASLSSDDWTGATMHVRTAHWTIASKTITACNTAQKTLTVNAAPVYGFKGGWGFFINNSLPALDTAGEWFYDSAAQKLYLKTPRNDNPSNYSLEGSRYKNGIEVNGKSYVSIQGLSIIGQAQYGIWINNASNVVIDGDSLLFQEACGIGIEGSGQNNTARNNYIQGANQDGIVSYGNGTKLSGNTIKNIALMRRFTKSGLGDNCCSGLGIEADGANDSISGNILDSIGYIGIRSNGAGNILEHNFIRHCCLTKDDGAGIYTGWQGSPAGTGSAGTVIAGNIVLATMCAPAGTPDIGYTPGEGIYIDDYGHDISILRNTTANCANHGIFLHHNKNIFVTGNVSYNNKVQFGFDESGSDSAGYVTDNIARNNVFYSLTEAEVCMGSSPVKTTPYVVATDSNYYCNPYSDAVITYGGSAYTLDAWRIAKGLDAHSKLSRQSFMPYRVLSITGADLIANGTFSSSIAPWSGWPGAVSLAWETNKGLDSGCMKVLYNNDSAAQASLVYPSSFSLAANQAYLLSFSVISNKTGSLQAIVRQAHAPWNVLGLSKYFIMGTTRKNYSAVFYANATDAQSRVDFSNTKSDSLYWLDNVSIVPVRVSAEDPLERSVLFYNATMQNSVVSLAGRTYHDLDGNSVAGSITLPGFESRVLVADSLQPSSVLYMKDGRIGGDQCAVSAFYHRNSFAVTMNLPEKNRCIVRLCDIRGRSAGTLFDGNIDRGKHTVRLAVQSVTPGTYCLQVKNGRSVFVKKIAIAQ